MDAAQVPEGVPNLRPEAAVDSHWPDVFDVLASEPPFHAPPEATMSTRKYVIPAGTEVQTLMIQEDGHKWSEPYKTDCDLEFSGFTSMGLGWMSFEAGGWVVRVPQKSVRVEDGK